MDAAGQASADSVTHVVCTYPQKFAAHPLG